MRKLDKIKNVQKANKLTENRYLSEKNKAESNGDIELAKYFAKYMLAHKIDLEAKDINIGNWLRTDSLIIFTEFKNYEFYFKVDIELTKKGSYTPERRSGHPDNWYPEESESNEFEFTLNSVIIKESKTDKIVYEGKFEFDEVFNMKIENWILEVMLDKIDELYWDMQQDY